MTTTTEQASATFFNALHGHWYVRHHRLQRPLEACAEWRSFDGTSETRPVLAGYGNIEDNWIDDPLGAYRAIAIRSFDCHAGLWRIWWHDQRRTAIDPPVTGRPIGGVGEFVGSDRSGGIDILVRFRWSGIDSAAPHWEQAFSADRGNSWETNWAMDFTRP